MNDVELGNGITKCEVDNGLSFFYKIMKKENGAINVEELIKAIEKLYSLFIEANPGIILNTAKKISTHAFAWVLFLCPRGEIYFIFLYSFL